MAHPGTGTQHESTVAPQAPASPGTPASCVVGSGRGPHQPERQSGVRVLGPGDVAEALDLIAADPVVNVFADYRTRITQLDTRWLGGEMWGYHEGDKLVSMCHVGANMVPVNATPAACAAFVERAATSGPRSSTIVGPQESVAAAVGRTRGALAAPARLALAPAAHGRDARRG